MGIIGKFARLIGSWNELGRISHKLDEVVAGIDNQSRLTNEKSAAMIDGITYLATRINFLIDRIDHAVELKQAQLILQREEADAIDELIMTIKSRAPAYAAPRDAASKLDLDLG